MADNHIGDLSLRDVLEAIDMTLEDASQNCHNVSIEILRHGLVEGRVARGWCAGVPGQHSWVVEGNDTYDPEALIVDATLWSYRLDVAGLWVGSMTDDELHQPHNWCNGQNIFEWGRPPDPTDTPIQLTPKFKLSHDALLFLNLLGPLDRQGWAILTTAPVTGWPASEIIAAMNDTEELSVLVPIDLLGMLTDRNPLGAYLVVGEA